MLNPSTWTRAAQRPQSAPCVASDETVSEPGSSPPPSPSSSPLPVRANVPPPGRVVELSGARPGGALPAGARAPDEGPSSQFEAGASEPAKSDPAPLSRHGLALSGDLTYPDGTRMDITAWEVFDHIKRGLPPELFNQGYLEAHEQFLGMSRTTGSYSVEFRAGFKSIIEECVFSSIDDVPHQLTLVENREALVDVIATCYFWTIESMSRDDLVIDGRHSWERPDDVRRYMENGPNPVVRLYLDIIYFNQELAALTGEPGKATLFDFTLRLNWFNSVAMELPIYKSFSRLGLRPCEDNFSEFKDPFDGSRVLNHFVVGPCLYPSHSEAAQRPEYRSLMSNRYFDASMPCHQSRFYSPTFDLRRRMVAEMPRTAVVKAVSIPHLNTEEHKRQAEAAMTELIHKIANSTFKGLRLEQVRDQIADAFIEGDVPMAWRAQIIRRLEDKVRNDEGWIRFQTEPAFARLAMSGVVDSDWATMPS